MERSILHVVSTSTTGNGDMFFAASSPRSTAFPLNSNPNYVDQQSTSIDAPFDSDTVKAAQNIFALLQETQFAADTEVRGRATHILVDERTRRSLV